MIAKTFLITVAKEVVKTNVKKKWSALKKDHRALAILQKFKWASLTEDFDSIYAHALAKFGLEKEPADLVLLFAQEEVKKAFHKDLLDETGSFNCALDDHLHTNRNLLPLKSHFGYIEELEIYIKEFKTTFNSFKELASNPMMLELYKGMQVLVDQAVKDSFEYQVDLYLKDKIQDFQDEFLDRDLYIELNGEIKQKKATRALKETTKKQDKGEKDVKLEIVEYKPLDKLINLWLNDNSKNLLVILGEYGTGKTTFTRYLTHQLASKRLEVPTISKVEDKLGRIPLYFPLRDFEKTMETFVTSQCNNYGITQINFAQFLKKIDQNELVVILDGFDEMTQKVDSDERRKNFAQIRNIIKSSGQSKIILTCREEYFQSEEDLEDIFKQNPSYSFMHLQKFTDEQIKEYLVKSPQVNNPETVWEKIQSTFDLHDLATRPVLLEMIVKYLPELINTLEKDQKIKASDLYRSCIKDELDRKEEKLSFNIPGKNRLEILKKIAAWMFDNDTLSFDTRLIGEQLDLKKYFNTTTDWEYEKHLSEFLTFTFLIREGNYQFRISHKSFRDYLTAIVWAEELRKRSLQYFSRIKTTEELQNFILEQPLDKAYLLHLVLTAKNLSAENQFQGTNAALLLLCLDKSALVNQDLTDCVLKEINLQKVILEKTILKNTNLSESLIDSSLLGADVRGSIELTGCELDLTDFKSKDYSSISNFRGLRSLNLFASDILDLEPLVDLQELRELILWDTMIENFEPLSGLINLEKLDLYGTKIENLEAIKKYKNLNWLDIDGTPISDFVILDRFTKLSHLRLNENYILLDQLKGFYNLEELFVSNSQIIDLTPLDGLSKLKKLGLIGTQVADLTPLANFTKLITLYLGGTQVADLTPVVNLTNLNSLHLNSTQVDDLTPLANLTNLNSLHLDSTQVDDLTPLANLTNLNSLHLDSTQVDDLMPLANLTNLNSLYMNSTQVDDLMPLANLTNLNSLYLNGTQVDDLTPLANFTKLITLYLGGTQVADLTPLVNLTNLNSLHLDSTQIADLTPLANLTNLNSLQLDSTQVDDLTPLANLTNLNSLHLNSTQVDDLMPLTNLTNLNSLHLNSTQVDDLMPLTNLTNLNSLHLIDCVVGLESLTMLQKALPDLHIITKEEE